MPLLPAFLARLIDKSCAIPMSGSQVTSCHEHTPAHRLSAWAARGLASHNELRKTLRTIPTYIIYDNVTQCFGHEPLSGAMRFSEKTERPAPLVTHGRNHPLSGTEETWLAAFAFRALNRSLALELSPIRRTGNRSRVCRGCWTERR